ncbi:hypothetical protein ACH5RR_040886 [Cinchona calisaya]|uniref:Transposase n=1 Tax=Cinchona calisaya TaxID=153742 RepID=A0ABD2XY17_9GENT
MIWYLNKNYDVEACANHPVLGKKVFLDRVSWVQAHRYVLNNLDIVQPYREIHMSTLTVNYPHAKPNQIRRLHNETFHEWFKKQVEELCHTSSESISEDITILAAGPSQWARSYKACMVNDFHFKTKTHESSKTTQNSGFMCKAKQVCYMTDPLEPSWQVVAKMTRRDNFDVYSRDRNIEPIIPQELDDRPFGNDRGGGWVRQEMEGTIIADEAIIVENVGIEDLEEDP